MSKIWSKEKFPNLISLLHQVEAKLILIKKLRHMNIKTIIPYKFQRTLKISIVKKAKQHLRYIRIGLLTVPFNFSHPKDLIKTIKTKQPKIAKKISKLLRVAIPQIS
jgi:hypothetical protein